VEAASIQMHAFFAARQKLPPPDVAAKRGAQILSDYDKWAKGKTFPGPAIVAYVNNRITLATHEPIPDSLADLFEIYLPFAVVDRAVEYLNDDKRELAALHLVEAALLLPNVFIRQPLQELAARGGQARRQKYEPLREMARRLATNGHYPSRRNAALAIARVILPLAPTYGIRLSEQQAERTITGWARRYPVYPQT
jgi:hypothetical protein